MKQKILLLTILTFCCHSIYAQTDGYINPDTGRVWNNPTSSLIDTQIVNQTQSMQTQQQAFSQMVFGNMQMTALKERFGDEKIKAGKATTRIALSPKGSYIEQWAAKGKTAKEKDEIKTIGNLCLQTFNNILKSKGLTAYDMTDGQALAFVMSYSIYFDKDPGDSRLQKLRQAFKQSYLKSAVDQGTLDSEKQQDYERLAVSTMLGYRAYQLLKKQNVSAQDKETAAQTARQYASGVLKQFWSEPSIDTIELINTGNGFGDKGERVTTSGKGVTTFNRSEKSAWANAHATCFERDGITSVRGDTSCFYEMRKRFDAEVAKLGGTNNDVAYANAVAFKIIYLDYLDIELNAKQFNWVLNEMRKDVSGSVNFQNATNSGKQDYYDSLAFDSLRIRDDFKTANNKYNHSKTSNDTSSIMEAKMAYNLSNSAKRRAQQKLQDIFQPRDLNNYELRPDGFVKIR